MSTQQHTILALAMLVLGLRLLATKRLQKAYSAVFGAVPVSTAASLPAGGGTPVPGGPQSGGENPPSNANVA